METHFLSIPLVSKEATWFATPLLSANAILEIFIFLAACFAIIEFRQHRKKIRSEATVRALVSIKSCIAYINEIILKTSYYEHLNYFPFQIPEVGSREVKIDKFPERPARLIYNRIGIMQRELDEPFAQIAGKEGKLLLDLSNQLQKNLMSIGNHVGGKLLSIPEIDILMDNAISESENLIKNYFTEIEKILIPIIEGRGNCYYFYTWISKKVTKTNAWLKNKIINLSIVNFY